MGRWQDTHTYTTYITYLPTHPPSLLLLCVVTVLELAKDSRIWVACSIFSIVLA